MLAVAYIRVQAHQPVPGAGLDGRSSGGLSIGSHGSTCVSIGSGSRVGSGVGNRLYSL